MGRRLGRPHSRALREGVAGGRNRPGEPSRPSLRRPLRRPLRAPGSADAIAGAARQRPLRPVAHCRLPDLRLPGHDKPLARAHSAATRPQAEIATIPAKSEIDSATVRAVAGYTLPSPEALRSERPASLRVFGRLPVIGARACTEA